MEYSRLLEAYKLYASVSIQNNKSIGALYDQEFCGVIDEVANSIDEQFHTQQARSLANRTFRNRLKISAGVLAIGLSGLGLITVFSKQIKLIIFVQLSLCIIFPKLAIWSSIPYAEGIPQVVPANNDPFIKFFNQHPRVNNKATVTDFASRIADRLREKPWLVEATTILFDHAVYGENVELDAETVLANSGS